MSRVFSCYSPGCNGQYCYKNTKNCVHNLEVERKDLGIPKGRVRSCYRLNLRLCINTPTPSLHTGIESTDLDAGISNCRVVDTPLEAAIQTAKIFNGIIVGKDGVLLSQNERAEKKLLGKTIREGQSSQAVKIGHMIDLADSLSNNLASSGDREQEQTTSKPTSQLLLVRGQFDDFRRLISEGAEVLRKKKTLSLLPRSVLGRTSNCYSTKDVINPSRSYKIMRRTIEKVRSLHRQKIKRLLKTQLRRRNLTKAGEKP